MKKLIINVLVILAIWALLYGIWSFALWNINPKEWEMASRVFYCFISTIASFSVIIGIAFYDDTKS